MLRVELENQRITLTLKSAEDEARGAQRAERRRTYQDRQQDGGGGGGYGEAGGEAGAGGAPMRNKFDPQRRAPRPAGAVAKSGAPGQHPSPPARVLHTAAGCAL